MAKFRLFSDLHLEFAPMAIIGTKEDKDTTLLLAGDIAVAKRPATYLSFLEDALNRFARVIYIPGNHEYYGGSFRVSWANAIDKVASHLSPELFNKLHMINNYSVVVDNATVVVGATLWTDFGGENYNNMVLAGQYMNDYRVIRRGTETDPWSGKLRPEDTLLAHRASRQFIFDTIRQHKLMGKQVVVMTHHGCSNQSIAESFLNSPLNPAYVSELGYQLLELDDEGLAPDIWVHGHVHHSLDYKIGSTRVITNPRGYVLPETPEGENPRFNPTFAFEV